MVFKAPLLYSSNVVPSAKLIPKIIHYCWFGETTLDTTMKRCIDSWRTFLPDYEIYAWGNQHIPQGIPYVDGACRLRNWSNLSNFFRYAAVYQYGGIYLDTDVELLRPIDSLLDDTCFLGCQVQSPVSWMVNVAVMGARPRHWFIGDLLRALLERFNGDENSSLSSVHLVSTLLKRLGMMGYSDTVRQIRDVTIYPTSYFYPISYLEKDKLADFEAHISQETLMVHYWIHSWIRSDTPRVLQSQNPRSLILRILAACRFVLGLVRRKILSKINYRIPDLSKADPLPDFLLYQ